jgi:hypothetical protein
MRTASPHGKIQNPKSLKSGLAVIHPDISFTNVELGQVRSFVVNHLYYRSGTRQRAEVQEAKGQ